MIGLPLPRPTDRALRVLAIGCHSDDIEIGAGGTLLGLIAARPEIVLTWVVLCGAGARGDEAQTSAAAFCEGLASPPNVVLGQFREIDGVPVEFPTSAMSAVRDRGSIPMLDWGSWDTKRGGVVQPAYRLANIAGGAHDVFIERFANAAKAWGHPFFLSLDPEMNGSWPTWSEQVNGNAPGDFVRMWRHVHDVFDRLGVTNVTWVWQVNTKYTGSIPIAGLYPGDADVDWVGISGYSWGNHPDRNFGWLDFDRLFTPIVTDITAVAPTKPVMIAETGASDSGGSKADWITDALTYEIPKRFLSIRAVLWFNAFDYPYDWAIQSTPAAQAAFAAAIALPLYAANEFGGLLP